MTKRMNVATILVKTCFQSDEVETGDRTRSISRQTHPGPANRATVRSEKRSRSTLGRFQGHHQSTLFFFGSIVLNQTANVGHEMTSQGLSSRRLQLLCTVHATYSAQLAMNFTMCSVQPMLCLSARQRAERPRSIGTCAVTGRGDCQPLKRDIGRPAKRNFGLAKA